MTEGIGIEVTGITGVISFGGGSGTGGVTYTVGAFGAVGVGWFLEIID